MRTISILVCLICTFYSGHAERIKIESVPSWLYKVTVPGSTAPDPASISNGYFLGLYDHQINLATKTEFLHFTREIVNETGVQNASEVSVSFAPDYQSLIFHKVSVWRNGKIVNHLNLKEVKVVQEETDADQFQYNGTKRAFITLKDVQKGDRIEVAYSLQGFNPVFNNHFSQKLYFSAGIIIQNCYETIIVPEDRKLNVQVYNSAPAAKQFTVDNMQVFHWDNPVVATSEAQTGVPGWFNNEPFVSITEYNDWKEVVNWATTLFNNYQYPLSAEMREQVKKWQSTAGVDKDLYASLAIQFVQDNVRYLGMEIGINSHKPHDPAEIYKQKYGDCKDKALLLVTLLRANNIPAYVALVNTYQRRKLPDALPSGSAFNHAIVAIPRSADYIFVDATTMYQRGDLVNIYIPDYGYALVIKQGEEKLTAVEPGPIYNADIEQKIYITAMDSCKMSITSIHRGGAADAMRNTFAETSKKDLGNQYVEYYKKSFKGIGMTDPLSMLDDTITNQITLKESYKMPSAWNTDSNGKKSVVINAAELYSYIPDPATAYENAPIALKFPLSIRYVIEVNMPENWDVSFKETHVKTASFKFDFESKVVNKKVFFYYNFKTFKDHIPAEEIASYIESYKQIEPLYSFDLFYRAPIPKNPGIQFLPNVNWTMVAVAALTIILLVPCFQHFNKRSADIAFPQNNIAPLRSWVMVLGFTLCAGLIAQAISLINSGYFNQAVWLNLEQQGGNRMTALLLVEFLFNFSFFLFSGMLIYWFFIRRDIFPYMFLVFIISYLTLKLLMISLYYLVDLPSDLLSVRNNSWKELFRTLVYSAVWGRYVYKSQRVRSTFLVPYRAVS